MLVGGSNGFCCDWQRSAVISFAVAIIISEALVIGIIILEGNQYTVLVIMVKFVVGNNML